MMPNNYLKKIKILIIDDLGAEMVSKWSLNEIFFPLLDYRYEKKLFTIFTSNYSVENLKKLWLKCGIDSVSINRLVSRIKGMCVEYELIGKDRRSM
jgi:primosomal protein DnaI